MKLWLVTGELHPFAGGIGVYAHHAARMLAQGGVQTTVVFHDPTVEAAQPSWVDGYRLIRFGGRFLCGEPIRQPELHGPLAAAFAVCEMLKRLIAEEDAPDVVEAQDYGALAYFFLKHRLMQMGADAPRVVLTAHRPYVHCAATDEESPFDHRTVFLGDAERWCYAAADAVIAPCGFIVEALRRPALAFPLRDGDVHVVANPYDPQTLAEAPLDALVEPLRLARARRQYAADEPLLYFGKLQVQKGAPDLVAALAALAARDRAHPLWMWGRDALHSPSGTSTLDWLQTRHRALFHAGLVRYFGDYGLGTVRALCAGHPVCVLPYREECLPYAFIEVALAGGLPLTRAGGGQAELVPEPLRALLLVDDFDHPDPLGERLDRLKALAPHERAAVSRTLAAEVRRQTGYAAVLPRKLAALAEVRLRSTADAYPFVHGEALNFGTVTPEARCALAAAVPQRGATLEVRTAGPAATDASDGDLVSVVIPFHDMHPWIGETLASVEAQSHPRVEVVIVDDGSPDPEARRALDAILRAPRRFATTVVRKRNGGLADARNTGARCARGDFLYFLDADDTLHPALLAESLKVLKRFANVAYVGAWLREFEGGSREWVVWDIDGPYIGYRNLQICSFLIRAEAFLRHGVQDPAMSFGMEDYEAHVRMYAAGARGVALPRTWFNYRIRAGSMSRRFNPAIQAFLYRRIAEANPAFFARHGALLAGMAAENGHGALAPGPTEETPYARSMLRVAPAPREAVEHELEANAGQARLTAALQGRVREGGPHWDYVTARLLLALDRDAAFAQRLLVAAAAREPGNGWFRLYAVLALLRAGRLTMARALWTPAFTTFCRAERSAVAWVAGLEALRGFAHAQRALSARLAAEGEPPLPGEAAFGDGTSDAAAVDARFPAAEAALRALRDSLAIPASGPGRLGACARQVTDAVATLMSPEAAGAMLRRRAAAWAEAGDIGRDGPTRLGEALGEATAGPEAETTAAWGRTAATYEAGGLAALLRRTDLSSEELADAQAWRDICEPPSAAARAGGSTGGAPGAWRPGGRRSMLARLDRLRR